MNFNKQIIERRKISPAKGIWNPSFTYKKFGTQNRKSRTVHDVESRIQDCLGLSYIGRKISVYCIIIKHIVFNSEKLFQNEWRLFALSWRASKCSVYQHPKIHHFLFQEPLGIPFLSIAVFRFQPKIAIMTMFGVLTVQSVIRELGGTTIVSTAISTEFTTMVNISRMDPWLMVWSGDHGSMATLQEGLR